MDVGRTLEPLSADARLALFADKAPRMPWDRFVQLMFRPQPGEHTGIIGPTGQGKTNLQNHILPMYPFVAAFATKGQDISMDRLIRDGGYVKLDHWYKLSARDVPRRVIWPRTKKVNDLYALQKKVFEGAIDQIFAEGGRPKEAPVGWAIAIDELWWFSNMLNMAKYLKTILLQGRSYGISLIGATQRPAWVPVEVYSSSTHLFFFHDTDENNLKRLADINYGNKRLVKELVSNLEQYQVLYVNTRTGMMARTRAPAPRG